MSRKNINFFSESNFFFEVEIFSEMSFFKNIFFSDGFFRLFFFRSEFFGGAVSKRKLVLFRFMGFSGRFGHSFAPFGAIFGSCTKSTAYKGRLWTKEVFGLH